jgi:hypothetical protein
VQQRRLVLTKFKHLQKIQLFVDGPMSESDFCEGLITDTTFGTKHCPPLNETLVRAVAKDIYEEFLAKNQEVELVELTIVFRRHMIYDRGQSSIMYCPIKVSREKGIDKALLATFNSRIDSLLISI